MTTKKTPAPAAMSVTLTDAELRVLLAPVVPFASNDDRLPVLTAVSLNVRGGYLVAAATDRFRMAMQRVRLAAGVPDGFAALVDIAFVKKLLAAFKPVRGRDPLEVTLTVEDDTIWATAGGGFGFDLADIRIGSRLILGQFPTVETLVTRDLAEQPTADVFGLNPSFLAAFKTAADVHGEPVIVVRPGVGAGKPVMVQVGDDFLGLLMPRKSRDVGAPPFAHGWAEFLGDNTAPAKAAS